MNFEKPYIYNLADPAHTKRERAKARELKTSQWWKQQVGLGICYHCQQKFSKEELTMEHLVPLSRGGKTSKKNCVVSCRDCNAKRGHHFAVEILLHQDTNQR